MTTPYPTKNLSTRLEKVVVTSRNCKEYDTYYILKNYNLYHRLTQIFKLNKKSKLSSYKLYYFSKNLK